MKRVMSIERNGGMRTPSSPVRGSTTTAESTVSAVDVGRTSCLGTSQGDATSLCIVANANMMVSCVNIRSAGAMAIESPPRIEQSRIVGEKFKTDSYAAVSHQVDVIGLEALYGN
jgi:hypothetical protein